jgi:cytochrome c biogenesis protein CcmG, thiol:disulfide interchange protein DsbE
VTTSRGAVLLVAVLLLQACATVADPGDVDAAGPRVPDRSMATLDGAQLSLADLTGDPLVVNLWASWCPPCVAEMPDLERVHLDLGEQVRFVGINTQDDVAEADALAARTGVTYELTLDPDGAVFRDLEVVAMPTTFLVDADGVIVHRHAGLLTEQQLRQLLDEHLGVA